MEKKNNFYEELIFNIENEIEKNNYSKAWTLILTELEMPYIPISFEQKLLNYKTQIERIFFNFNKKNISLENIIDLLLNKKLNNLDKYEIVEQLEKFNLKNDVFYSFLKNPKIDFLLKLKALAIFKNQEKFKNIEINLNHEKYIIKWSDLFDVNTNKNFAKDSKELESILFKIPNVLNSALEILEKYYFVEFILNKNVGNLWKEILFIVSKLYNEVSLQKRVVEKLVDDNDEFKKNVIKILNTTKY